MLKKPSELNFTEKKLKVIISGYAGIGKTTLALSAPKPLLIDLDHGIDRVEARYRQDVIIASDYNELIEDLTTNDLTKYETIVIDTGGKLLELLKPVVINENPKNGQRDGSLALAGWGAVSKKFTDFMKMIEGLKKHVVVVFHTKEERDGDAAKLRILVEGSTKDNIWQIMDLGGFVEMNGKNRTIGFSNCERYYAKGSHGVKGVYTIPELKDGQTNTFLSDLFKKVIEDLNNEVQEYSKDKDVYDIAMSLTTVINSATTAENINEVVEKIANMPHALTSERELKLRLHEKAKELGLVYDKDQRKYTKQQ
jgi:predicted house-cleaning noncanonical NTP pyrophosphatase (MazG superfamily)